MKTLYAPWRGLYARSCNKKNKNECIFCIQAKEQQDTAHFILKRYTHCFIMLNKYPYNAGHLLVIPFAHTKSLNSLEKAARTEIMEVANYAITVLEKVLEAQGVNAGINLGPASNASIPDHIHLHLLPRWEGDTNFLPALANTKVVSFDLKQIYDQLKPAFEEHSLDSL